ncbi:glutaredoxin family protein [Cryobacterium zhongshanensis]|uniref:Glutaredoxin family protein n=1 Tax=Cryobacterium zhongshanensis TaxID=2928153 RepID=A0AA41UH84_9MICO|nr:glutaredoxin family protein [Cryobacterium zhongshanensis]MCI4659645.1 glutaredoxin family protein [Cryobacterium zhongshanensis]
MTADTGVTVEAPAITVTIFSKNDCTNCTNTEKQLDRRGVPYREINVQEDTAPREEFGGRTPFEHVVETYGRQMPVVVVNDHARIDWWAGARIDKMLDLVKQFDEVGQLIPEDQRVAR